MPSRTQIKIHSHVLNETVVHIGCWAAGLNSGEMRQDFAFHVRIGGGGGIFLACEDFRHWTLDTRQLAFISSPCNNGETGFCTEFHVLYYSKWQIFQEY